MKIIDYTIVIHHNNEDDEYEFIDEVRKVMKQGFQPLGGHSLSIAHNPETGAEFYLFSQTLVKYDEGAR